MLLFLFVWESHFSLNLNYNLMPLISLATGLTYMPLISKRCISFQCDFSRCLEELFSSHPCASYLFFFFLTNLDLYSILFPTEKHLCFSGLFYALYVNIPICFL